MAVIITGLVTRRRTILRFANITLSDCQTLLSVSTLRRYSVIKTSIFDTQEQTEYHERTALYRSLHYGHCG
jgi:hypothetical protein